jgi:fructoselysine-6-P-deglycase FrlB-like protein
MPNRADDGSGGRTGNSAGGSGGAETGGTLGGGAPGTGGGTGTGTGTGGAVGGGAPGTGGAGNSWASTDHSGASTGGSGVSTGGSIESEVASQPECWLRAAELAAEVTGLLPAPGERVAVAGCGTSWFMAQSYAAAREAAGHGETDAFAASEFPAGRRYDRILALSRSGTTTEILDLLARAGRAAATVAITADARTPVAAAAGAGIALGFADERSVVQTRFATSELALLRAHLGQDLAPVAAAARRVLAAPLPAQLIGARQFTFLGTGWTCGLASEAALKLREAAGMWTEAYPAMEYRHGPIAVTGPGSVVWLLGPAPDGLTREITAAGGLVWQSQEDPMTELVRVHRLAAAAARARGLDPDQPRNLSRSVILDTAGPG